jgi:hypothetical protein
MVIFSLLRIGMVLLVMLAVLGEVPEVGVGVGVWQVERGRLWMEG